MQPFYPSSLASATNAVPSPPHARAAGGGAPMYSGAWGMNPVLPVENNRPYWQDGTEGLRGAVISPRSMRSDRGESVRSEGYFLPEKEESFVSACPLSPSAFAAPARALAASVATPLANYTRRCLLDALSSIVGKKLLLLDETLAGPLSLLVDSATLQQQGVDRCFPLRSYPLYSSAVSPATAAASLILFFCRPHLSLLPLIARHIHFIERTYAPTRPQGEAAIGTDSPKISPGGGDAHNHTDAVPQTYGAGDSRKTFVSPSSPSSVATDIFDNVESEETSRVHHQKRRDRKFSRGSTGQPPPLTCRFPVPTSFSPSGRHYFVVCIPTASDFFISEFRRFLISGTVSDVSDVAGVRGGIAGSSAGSASGPSTTAANAYGRPQPQETSVSGAAGMASSLFSNLSSLPGNLFGGVSGSTSSQGSPPGAKQQQQNISRAAASAAVLPPPLSQSSATVTSCPLFFFPLAQDLLSLELRNSYRDLHLYGDRTPSQIAAAAIVLLQEKLHGALIPQLRSLGTAAKAVADQLIRHRKERQAQANEQRQQQQFAHDGLPGDFLKTDYDIYCGGPARAGGGGGGGLAGGPALSYSAAAAAARAYRFQGVDGCRKDNAALCPPGTADADTAAARAGSGASVASNGKRVPPLSPTRANSDYDDLQGAIDFSLPLLPLAPPTRFVLSRDDVTLDEDEDEEDEDGEEDEEEEEKGEKEEVSKRSSTQNVDKNAATRAHAAGSPARGARPTVSSGTRTTGEFSGDERLSSHATYEEKCSRQGDNVDFRGHSPQAATRGGGQCEYVKIDMLVLIDRRSDLITPLCTAFTYEALLDSVFGIDAAGVDIPQQLLLQQPQQQKQTPPQQHPTLSADGGMGSGRGGSILSFSPFFGGEKETDTRSRKVIGVPVLLPLGPRRRISLLADGLYALLRDLHQSAVGAQLYNIASGIQQTYKEKDALRSIQEISVFISKFRVKQKEHSSLSLHVRLASFLAAVTQDPAFVQRLALEDELLQSDVSSSSTTPLLKSSVVNQLEAFLEDAVGADRLWWAPDVGGADAVKSGSDEHFMQHRLSQSHHGGSNVAMAAAGLRVGSEVTTRWKGTAAAGTGLVDFYRLLCLASLVNGGLRSKQMENIRAGLLQHFGFEEVQRLALLHRVGLLRQTGGGGASAGGGGGASGSEKTVGAGASVGGDTQSSRSDVEGGSAAAGGGLAPGTWKILKKECNLLADATEGDQAMMDSIAYACSGYAPLSVRVSIVINNNCLSAAGALVYRLSCSRLSCGSGESKEDYFFLCWRLVTVYYREIVSDVIDSVMRGVTHAEVAAIRRLNEIELQRYRLRKLQSCENSGVQTEDAAAKLRRFVIMTTEVTNARKLIESCREPAIDIGGRFGWSPCICSEDGV